MPITNKRQSQKGQALVLVTFALFAMFGLIGLAVDLGWAFYIEKTAQAAADAAALAAVKRAMDTPGVSFASVTCGAGSGAIGCAATPVDCPSGGGIAGTNLESACTYARVNGFDPTTNTRQRVRVQASDINAPSITACTVAGANGCSVGACANIHHPPTAPCVDTVYWVTVRVVQTVPQLFSMFMGFSDGQVSARATAAVAKGEVTGGLILLNRENESWAGNTGTNLELQGSGIVDVPPGIVLSSNSSQAGFAGGGGTVKSPATWIRTPGQVVLQGSSTWTAPPSNRADGGMFMDPFRGLGQPPLDPNTPSLPHIPVMETNGGRAFLQESASVPGYQNVCPSNVCVPGIYYAVDSNGVATGTQIEVPADNRNALAFQKSGGTSQFGDYVFFGGLNVGQRVVNFGPGRYVLAGVSDPRTPLFNNDNAAQLLSSYAGAEDPGRIFILTDSHYGTPSGGPTILEATAATIANKTWSELGFSQSTIQSGNNDNSRIELTGLSRQSTEVPTALQRDFAPVVIWQDQQNSRVEYTPEGQVKEDCGGGINLPCPGSQLGSTSPQLTIWATPKTSYKGAIYQPRGAWTVFQASGKYNGALQIISGALQVQGTPDLTLVGSSDPITRYMAALVE